jgi:hypothetical protein
MRDPSLLVVTVSFIVLALLFGLVERLMPAVRTQRTLRPGITTDLIYWFTTPFFTRVVSRIGVLSPSCRYLPCSADR